MDIKPHNVLYDESKSINVVDDLSPVVLLDLGSVASYPINITSRKEALQFQEKCSINCSAAYRAPELWDVASNCVITASSDVWSLGCLLYCLAFGSNPFESSTEGVQTLAIMNGKYLIPENNIHGGVKFSARFVKLVSVCSIESLYF